LERGGKIQTSPRRRKSDELLKKKKGAIARMAEKEKKKKKAGLIESIKGTKPGEENPRTPGPF